MNRRLVGHFPAVLLSLATIGNAQTVDFQKQIFPLLDKHCVECHSEGEADGELALDSFEGLMVGGKTGEALEPGRSGDSLLVKFLEGRSGKTGKNQFMPPGKREHLKPEEIALIKSWIDAGAKGPPVGAGQKTFVRREVTTPKVAPKGKVKRAIHALAFSPNAQLIATGRRGEVELIHPVTRASVRKLGGIKGDVNALAFSPDGASIYAAGGEPGIAGDIHRWRIADGSLVKEYPGHTDACYALAVSPDGKWVTTGGYDQKIRLWDAETGAELKTIKGHNGAIYGLAFRPDGKVLASASADRTVKLWSIPNGERLDTFSQPTKEQMAVAFSPDGRHIIAGGADNRIRSWTVSATAKEGTNPIGVSRFAHEGAILQLAFSADGATLISSASDKTVKIWNAADLTEKRLLEKQADWPQALAFAGQNRFAAGLLDGSLAIYDTESGKAVQPPAPPKPELSGVDPRGLQSGVSSLLTITGKNLSAEMKIHFPHPGLVGEVIAGAKPTAAKVRVTADATVPRGAYDIWLSSAGGESAKTKIFVDDLHTLATRAADFKNGPLELPLPASVWGALTEVGQQDQFRFRVKKNETVVFDLGIKTIESKALTPTLTLLDASGNVLAANRGLDSGSDPFLAFKAQADGEFIIRVSETTLEGSRDYRYRLTAGMLPFVTGWHPLSAQAGRETEVQLVGFNLPAPTLRAKAAATGVLTVPLDAKTIRSRKPVQLIVTDLPHLDEIEPNDDPQKAQAVTIPVSVNGRLFTLAQVFQPPPLPKERENAVRPASDPPLSAGDGRGEGKTKADSDLFAFDAKAGKPLIIETLAAMAGSPADTKIEILDSAGKSVPRMLLQAVRDSWINFRSIDADNPDARVANWQEMDLNELIYFSGDVARIFRLPRGPDSGFLFYAVNGKRRAYFDTTATAHALDEPCHVVEPKPVGSQVVPNGLPVFTLNYANDDSGYRKMGSDSQLTFIPSRDGRYLARVSDTRGWSGERHAYRLTIREPAPDFAVTVDTAKLRAVPAGGAMGFSVKADRKDGFDAPIEVTIEGLPPGFHASSPLVIEAGHDIANGSLFAAPDAPKDADWSKVTIKACAIVAGNKICKPVGGFGSPALGPTPKFAAFIEPDRGGKPAMQKLADLEKPLEITVAPGQTTKAWLRVERFGNDALINFDVHNLPFGVIVDYIGLNGVQIREKENERDIFLTCAKWVAEQDRLVHAAVISARGEQDSAGVQTSFPLLLKVRKPATMTAR